MSKAVKTIVGVAAAIAIPFAAPAIASSIGLSAAVGTAVGSATAGAVVGGAITGAALGAAKGAILGEDVGRSALLGGIGGGIGGYTAAPTVAPSAQAPVAASAGGTVPNAVVTNVGSGTGYWSPELAQYVDPATGSTIVSQNIAYGGNLPAAQLSTLQQGGLAATDVANNLTGLSVNTPTAATGFGAPQLGTTAYYNPNAGTGTFAPQATFVNETTGQVFQSSPVYAQAGLDIPNAQLATVGGGTTTGGAAQPGVPTITGGESATGVVPGTAGTTYAAATNAGGVVPGTAAATTTGAGQAPMTYTEALKARLTSPEGLADMTLRAAGLLAGSAIAGDGLSAEERELLRAQTDELRTLQQTNAGLFAQRLEQAQNLIGESKYFDPEYFGLQRARRAQTAAARAKRAGLRGLEGASRAAESRRFDLATARDVGTSYDQGYLAGVQGRLGTMQAGMQMMPTGFPSSMGDYTNLRGAYGAAATRARETQRDIGDLFGSLTGGQRSQSRGG